VHHGLEPRLLRVLWSGIELPVIVQSSELSQLRGNRGFNLCDQLRNVAFDRNVLGAVPLLARTFCFALKAQESNPCSEKAGRWVFGEHKDAGSVRNEARCFAFSKMAQFQYFIVVEMVWVRHS